MTTPPPPLKSSFARGLTFLELTVIILTLLAFISILFVGVRAWKKGADRAHCVLNIRQVQLAMRSYSVSRGLPEGRRVAERDESFKLSAQIIGPGKYLDVRPSCPAGGSYKLKGNRIPERGVLYMDCTLADSLDHVPKNYATW